MASATEQHLEHGTFQDKGLKSGALGLLPTVVIGMASTAPAYSLAASLAFVVIPVGLKAPAIMLLAFVPMFCIAVAYQELNKAEPDCGTTFTWAARAFGPRTGWMGGWGIIVADVIVMANLAQIAGSYSFRLFGADGLAESKNWVTLVGVVWIVVMTYICYRGIELSARIQFGLLVVEVIVLVLFAVVALSKVYGSHAPAGSLHPSLSWLWPGGMSLSQFSEAMVIAVFIYWGWDTAVAVNEECADPDTIPGRAAVISTVLLLATYAIVTIAALAFAGPGEKGLGLANLDNADDIVQGLGKAVLGGWTAKLLIISVLTSASASTQTTILPTARTTLSMGAFKAIPKSFARIHREYLTPTVSTIVMGIVSIVFYVGMTLVSENVLGDSITAVGLMIAFYYGLTGFVCAWFYRKQLTSSVRNFFMRGLIPLLGGVMLAGIFFDALRQFAKSDYGETSLWGIGSIAVLGVGSLLLGVVLMEIYARIAPDYFQGRTLTKGTPELVLGHAGTVATLGLPDSGRMPTVIAPDRSNLPDTVDPADVEEFDPEPDDDVDR